MTVHKPHQAQAPHSLCWGPVSAPALWPPPGQECTTLDCSYLRKREVIARSLQGYWNSVVTGQVYGQVANMSIELL